MYVILRANTFDAEYNEIRYAIVDVNQGFIEKVRHAREAAIALQTQDRENFRYIALSDGQAGFHMYFDEIEDLEDEDENNVFGRLEDGLYAIMPAGFRPPEESRVDEVSNSRVMVAPIGMWWEATTPSGNTISFIESSEILFDELFKSFNKRNKIPVQRMFWEAENEQSPSRAT